MLAWKDKVAEKLSRLLADSPSSPVSPAVESPFARRDSQAFYFPTDEFTSPKKSSFSSYVLSFLPSNNSGGIEGREVSPSPCPKSIGPLALKPLPRRWNVNDFAWKDRPLECSEESGTESENDEMMKQECVSDRKVDVSNGTQEASTSVAPQEFLHHLEEKSVFISADLFEFLQSSLPNIVRGCLWVLLYSTWKHGISLRTLLRKSVNLEGPCLLIAGDMQGAVFGGLLDSPLKPTAKRKYQGKSHTFVFTTIYGEPRLFRATGANRYYYLCLNDVLAFGGGGSFALCLDEDLLHGTSGPCETFGNLCLAHNPEFELKNVELWGFAHSSSHLL
ncbi:uncharacterized protein [Typha angustifolia]|uniref:uncharacterized protein n=1 Tax=Typha angustifolia TaxID=59011 RepID=UPI003C2E8FDE